MTPVPVRVSTNPPFSLDPALHLPDARPGPISHHSGNSNGTPGPALPLPNARPGRATYDERDHGQPLSLHSRTRTHA